MDKRRRVSVPHHIKTKTKTHVPSKYSSILNITRRNEQHDSDLDIPEHTEIDAEHTIIRKVQHGDVQIKQSVKNDVGKYNAPTTCIANSGHHCKPCHFKFHLPNFLKFHHHHHSKKDHYDTAEQDSLKSQDTVLLFQNNNEHNDEDSISDVYNDTFDFTEDTSTTVRDKNEILKPPVSFKNEAELKMKTTFNLHTEYDTSLNENSNPEKCKILDRFKLQGLNKLKANVTVRNACTQTSNSAVKDYQEAAECKEKTNCYNVAQKRQIFGNYGFGQELMRDRMHLHQKGLLEHWIWQKLSLCEEEDETGEGELIDHTISPFLTLSKQIAKPFGLELV